MSAQPVGLAMVYEMMQLASITLLKLVVHLTLHVSANLVELMVLKGAITHLRVIN